MSDISEMELTVTNACFEKDGSISHARFTGRLSEESLATIMAVITQAVKEERERFIKKVNELPELGSVLAGTVRRQTVLAILGIKHTHEAKYDGFQLLDECKKCGRDICEEIHTGGRP